jgi:EmrB/QacA subfamily drug resistance transporter
MSHPLCDTGVALCARAASQRRPLLTLITSILASSLAFVDGTVVSVGLPALGADLRANAQELQWVVNAYLLPLGALLLLGGALGDRFGQARMLIAGIVLFAAASAACAAAPGLRVLLIARALQGAGAALVLPNSLAVLGGAFEGDERGRAVGIWAASSAMSAAVGPVLGGWLIDSVGWRSIFLINLPLASAAGALALYAVRDQASEGRPARLDVAGAVFVTAALGAITFGLTSGSGSGGWSLWPVTALAAGVLLLLAFIWIERQRADDAMTPLALFGSARFVGLNLMTFLLYGALAGFVLLLPYRLIKIAGYSATAAGAALLPFPLVMTAASPVMGSLAGRMGSRAFLSIGPVLVAAGLALSLPAGPKTDYWTGVLPSVLVVALGMSCAAAPLTNAVLGSVDQRHTGIASGLNSALARIGGLIATALVGAVLGATGPAFLNAFHVAAIAAAIACLAAAAAVVLTYGDAAPSMTGAIRPPG